MSGKKHVLPAENQQKHIAMVLCLTSNWQITSYDTVSW